MDTKASGLRAPLLGSPLASSPSGLTRLAIISLGFSFLVRRKTLDRYDVAELIFTRVASYDPIDIFATCGAFCNRNW